MKRAKTPTFLLELPLQVDPGQGRRLHAHLEVARTFYNAMLGEAMTRLHRMCADPAWQAARRLPHQHREQRQRAFSDLRHRYHFSEYALHAHAKQGRQHFIADHLDSTMAQTLASRAFQAAQRVSLGQAKRVRFRSHGRGLDSVEGKRNDTGMRFHLQEGSHGNQGHLIWGQDHISALIDWHDPVVCHGLKHPIKFVRLVRRKASSLRAQGADCHGTRYAVQVVLQGHPFQKPKNRVGPHTLGLDIGPSTVAVVAKEGPVLLTRLADGLQPQAAVKRRLQRRLERQRRAGNPHNYDEAGRVKRGRLTWQESQGYRTTRRRLATTDRQLAAHRKSLHGCLVNDLVRTGNQIQMEKTSFRGWQKRFGSSIALRAPGLLIAHLRRTVAKTGGTLSEVSTYHTKLSQYCHGCQRYHKKRLSERWHQCACGIGPIQRDLYSAFLLACLPPAETIPSISRPVWEGAEPRLRAEIERHIQRATAGQIVPSSFGIPRDRARQLKSPARVQQESPVLLFSGGRVKKLRLKPEPPCL